VLVCNYFVFCSTCVRIAVVIVCVSLNTADHSRLPQTTSEVTADHDWMPKYLRQMHWSCWSVDRRTYWTNISVVTKSEFTGNATASAVIGLYSLLSAYDNFVLMPHHGSMNAIKNEVMTINTPAHEPLTTIKGNDLAEVSNFKWEQAGMPNPWMPNP